MSLEEFTDPVLKPGHTPRPVPPPRTRGCVCLLPVAWGLPSGWRPAQDVGSWAANSNSAIVETTHWTEDDAATAGGRVCWVRATQVTGVIDRRVGWCETSKVPGFRSNLKLLAMSVRGSVATRRADDSGRGRGGIRSVLSRWTRGHKKKADWYIDVGGGVGWYYCWDDQRLRGVGSSVVLNYKGHPDYKALSDCHGYGGKVLVEPKGQSVSTLAGKAKKYVNYDVNCLLIHAYTICPSGCYPWYRCMYRRYLL